MDNHSHTSTDRGKHDKKNAPRGKGLKIVAGSRKPLSNSQEMFNRQTKRVEELRHTILAVTAKLESLRRLYTAKMPALAQSLAKSRLALARALGNSTKSILFGKQQRENLRTVILGLCEEAFQEIEPGKEDVAFYDAWAESSYREEQKIRSDRRKQALAGDVKEVYGIDIDPDDIDDTPEGLARLARRLKEEFGGRQTDEHAPRRKKSRTQIRREEAQRQQDALKLKSLRSIYISLAKALHPDTIMDPGEKTLKEELMKKVTAAYADRDLSALLKLEVEWVTSAKKALDTLPDEKLNLYIASLKGQAAVLERELRSLYQLPRFRCIADFSRDPEPHASRCIHDLERTYANRIRTIQESIPLFSRPDQKRTIIAFVNQYVSTINSCDPLFHEEVMYDF